MLSKLWFFILLSRAPFLLGGATMYALGATVAYAEGARLDALRLAWGQIGVSSIQLMTHLVNEYFDAARDALVTTRTLFSGGSGILPSGKLGKRVAIGGAAVCAATGAVITLTVGWPVVLVYAGAMAIGFGYSTPPLRLMTRGLGEFGAALTMALLTPLAGYGIVTGQLSAKVMWLGLPLLPASVACMLVVELPDYETDRSTGKRNWVVRLGRNRAGKLHNGLLGLSYIVLALIAGAGRLQGQVASLLWLTLPMAMWQMGGVWLRIHRGWRHYSLLAVGGMALVGLYGLLAGLGYWI